MPPDSDSLRLRHMMDAAREAIQFSIGRSRDELEANRMLQLAEVRLVEIIGEATKGVSEELRRRYPEVAWRQISGTRDRLTHGYFDVDLDIVWTIITVDLPILIEQLEHILETEKA
jgi:uncharacterized protein with HEPN domain